MTADDDSNNDQQRRMPTARVRLMYKTSIGESAREQGSGADEQSDGEERPDNYKNLQRRGAACISTPKTGPCYATRSDLSSGTFPGGVVATSARSEANLP